MAESTSPQLDTPPGQGLHLLADAVDGFPGLLAELLDAHALGGDFGGELLDTDVGFAFHHGIGQVHLGLLQDLSQHLVLDVLIGHGLLLLGHLGLDLLLLLGGQGFLLLLLNLVHRDLKYSGLARQICGVIVFREGDVYIHLISGFGTHQLILKPGDKLPGAQGQREVRALAAGKGLIAQVALKINDGDVPRRRGRSTSSARMFCFAAEARAAESSSSVGSMTGIFTWIPL